MGTIPVSEVLTHLMIKWVVESKLEPWMQEA